jgi:hypothetical protein
MHKMSLRGFIMRKAIPFLNNTKQLSAHLPRIIACPWVYAVPGVKMNANIY